jgi:flagella basal body P-ring formation protein FlgA
MDVQLAKTVDSNSSREGVENLGDILGHVLSRDVGQGELFKASTLSIPPVITAGSPVMIVVRSGRLEVTATGTAIDSGAIGQEIKVRNEGSKKVVSGKVEGPGIVVVGAY